MTPKAIAGTDNWFYVRDSPNGAGKEIFHVAAWGLDLEGNVFGLVDLGGSLRRGIPILEPVPPEGDYVHRDKLDHKQLEAITSHNSRY